MSAPTIPTASKPDLPGTDSPGLVRRPSSPSTPKPNIPFASKPTLPGSPKPGFPPGMIPPRGIATPGAGTRPTIALPGTKKPPVLPNTPPPRAWQKTARPIVPSSPKPGGGSPANPAARAMFAQRGHSQSVSAIPNKFTPAVPATTPTSRSLTTADIPFESMSNSSSSTNEPTPSSPSGSSSGNASSPVAMSGSFVGGTSMFGGDKKDEDGPPVFPTEEEKQAQLKREQEAAKNVKKSDKQMLLEEHSQFVREVKMSYLYDGVHLERHVANQKPQQIVLKVTKEGRDLRWGLVPARGGDASLSEKIPANQLKKLELNPTFNAKQANLSFSLIIGENSEEESFNLVARNEGEYAKTIEGFRSVLGLPPGPMALKEINRLVSWQKVVLQLEEPYVADLSAPPAPPPPSNFDFITPMG